jgi:hypothetical protein
MKRVGGLFVLALLVSAVPADAQRGAGPPTATPVSGRPLLIETQNPGARTEQGIEQSYAKLIREAKNNRQEMEDQIRNLESSIEKLKQSARKIELVLQKLQELLPRIVGAVGSDPFGGKGRPASTGPRDAFEALLKAELARAGMNMSAEELRKLADEITKGGQGAMGVALQIVISIAQTSASRSLPGRDAGPGFPKVAPADLSAATPMRGSGAASYFASRFSKQAGDRLAETNAAISSAKQAIKSRKDQIAGLDKQIEKLQQDRDKAIADLRAQGQRALANALKSPTPTPRAP